MEPPDAQYCVLRVGQARLAYTFVPTVDRGGTIEAFTHAGERVFSAHSSTVPSLVGRIRSGDMRRPRNVARVEASYAANGYDGIFVAMWLLGRYPIVPHRSRTYRTAVVTLNADRHPVARKIVHRFPFSHGRLAPGLACLISNVYGITPQPNDD